MRSLIALIAAASMTGCISVAWPPARGGGVAEMIPSERYDVLFASASPAEREMLTTLNTLEADLADARERGAMTYVPAETTLARLLCARIRREIAGTLYSDAAKNLIELADRVDAIDRALATPIHPGEETPA